MKPKSLLFRAWLLLTLLAGSLFAGASVPSLDSKELAQGPYSLMHMLFEKTVLKIDVATIDVRFNKRAQSRFAELARGKPYSDATADQIARVAIEADQAVVQMRFLRSVSLGKWIDVVRENLGQARAAGLIDAKLEQRVSRGLPEWFAALSKRGYKEGDRLLYAVTPDSLRTAVVASDGQVLIDKVDREKGSQRVVLASYFAPGGDFRQPLIRSLWESKP